MTPRLVTRSVLPVALASAFLMAPIASGGAERGAGSLALHAELSVSGIIQATCPPEAPPEADFCVERSGAGEVTGLGSVIQTYRFFVDENPSPACGGLRVLASTGQLAVTGKGTIQVALARMEQCVTDRLQANRPFTITGGTGTYAGAAGAGAVKHDLHEGATGATGMDTWSGSLDVPGLEFDLTPPTLSGLVNKTVRVRKGVKRVRVKYRVTALDVVDGSRPVRCQPASGSRFKVGRTVVKCTATDSSANSVAGSFRVVVKRRR
jgi:hypothetical protein